MKRFLVIKDANTEYDFLYRRRGLGDLGDGVAYVHLQDETQWHGDFNEDTKVYGTNSQTEAEQLAQHLCAKFPTNKYMVCEVSMVYQTEVGPIKAAKFSDKGLMPV